MISWPVGKRERERERERERQAGGRPGRSALPRDRYTDQRDAGPYLGTGVWLQGMGFRG